MVTVAPSTVSKRSELSRATYSLAQYAALVGVSYTTAHECAQRGELPVTPIRHGRLYLFPKAAVHRLLEIDAPADDAA